MSKVKSYLQTTFVCISIALICLFGYLMLQNMCVELCIRWGWEVRTNPNLFENGFWLTLLVGAVMVPVLEELVFRFACCKLLQLTRMPIWCVIGISASIFMLYHGSCSQIIYQLLMGIWLAWIFIKTNQIGWTILIHFINNAFVLTYTYLTSSGNVGFDLNAWKIILSVGLAVVTTVAVIFLIQKGIPKYEK